MCSRHSAAPSVEFLSRLIRHSIEHGGDVDSRPAIHLLFFAKPSGSSTSSARPEGEQSASLACPQCNRHSRTKQNCPNPVPPTPNQRRQSGGTDGNPSVAA